MKKSPFFKENFNRCFTWLMALFFVILRALAQKSFDLLLGA
jgi:hypothetical protein